MSSAFSYYKSRELHEAIERADYDGVRALISDPEVNVGCIHNDFTPFAAACRAGNTPIIRLFLDCDRPIQYNTPSRLRTDGLYLSIGRPGIFRMLVDDPRINVNMTWSEINWLHLVSSFSATRGNIKVLLACDRFKRENVQIRTHDGRILSQEDVRKMFHPDGDLINAFNEDPVGVRYQLREELGGYPEFQAGELFANVVLLCDDYLKIKEI